MPYMKTRFEFYDGEDGDGVDTWEQVDYFNFTEDIREGAFDMLLDSRDWS